MTRFIVTAKAALIIIYFFVNASASFAQFDANKFETILDRKTEELLSVSLKWLPTVTITSLDPFDTTTFRNKKVIVKPFTDARKNQKEIGKNIEKRSPDYVDLIVTTKDSVAQWLTAKVGQVLGEFDITVADAHGDIIIESDILKYYVTEGASYKTDVALYVKLISSENKVLWEGMVTGKSDAWGKSYKEESYHQGLSNACIDLVYNLLKNEQIKQAVKGMK